jgi:hypothetical protein
MRRVGCVLPRFMMTVGVDSMCAHHETGRSTRSARSVRLEMGIGVNQGLGYKLDPSAGIDLEDAVRCSLLGNDHAPRHFPISPSKGIPLHVEQEFPWL